MRLTPDLLAATYSLLRETEPFRRWNLPDAEDVIFGVLRTHRWHGDYSKPDGKHHIRLSQAWHLNLGATIATMAHEMLHLHLEEVGAKVDSMKHGKGFQRVAKLICRHHPEFDLASF